MNKKYIDRMIDLQEDFDKQITEQKPLNLGKQSYQHLDIDHAGSPGFSGKNNITLPIMQEGDKNQRGPIWKQSSSFGLLFQIPNVSYQNLLLYQQQAALVRVNHTDSQVIDAFNNQFYLLQMSIESKNYEMNQKIFYFATQVPLYFLYFIELDKPGLIEQIKQDQLSIVTQVLQIHIIFNKGFVTKYQVACEWFGLNNFRKSQIKNFLYIELAILNRVIFNNGGRSKQKLINLQDEFAYVLRTIEFECGNTI
ncbi:unnamed protein product (macronuclear) [Paramecium tetraurelia]|uniref:Uncharacterized protein n=1 Tax=Paramecium tetraurelia TaxID=5888 RepID=A0CCI7_PARTE|nr:uncharacterized protein GSPATT00037289001 [Paramecium tetraurelia]CAK68504.1 unnamed protein product [Paramecium tetraurelia]|eukprot:XP_001435901.1 hypothetical protein (macronuclear) [Paramecium tetraurelia strain d4-2]